MLTPLLLAAAIIVPQTTPVPHTPSRKALYLQYGLARGADLGATEWALAGNPRALEGNPLMKNRGARIGVNTLAVVLLAEGTYQMQKSHPNRAKWFRRGVLLGSYGLAAWAGYVALHK